MCDKQGCGRSWADVIAILIVGIVALVIALCASSKKAEASQIEWKGVVVHISDSTHMTLEECNSWHRERGWDSCGYNFVIEPDGVVYEARGINKVGAHVKGWNKKMLGICFVSTDAATPEQIEAYKGLTHQYELDKLPRYAHHHFNPGKRCGTTVMKQLEAR
jgi:hypothetical protein